MKRFFHTELEQFRSNIVLMGELAIEAVRESLVALRETDPDRAKRVLAGDDRIDELEKLVDAEAIRYISLRAPVASELRLLTVGMKAGHDLERVGDEATSIAKRVIRLSGQAPSGELFHIPRMGEQAIGMLRDAVQSFLEGDEERATTLFRRDKEIDEMNRANFDAFGQLITKNPDRVRHSLELIWASKSIERVADHATNIAEEVLYLLRGEDLRHSAKVKELKR